MDNKKSKEYSFITEKIKEHPADHKKLLLRIGTNVVMAVIFGIVACFVFVVLRPYAESLVNPDTSKITIPKDESEEELSEDVSDDTKTKDDDSQVIYVTEEKGMELSDYQELQNQVYEIGQEASKSIVTVTGVTSDVDWFNNTYEDSGQAAGVIVGENGKEYLILTERRIIEGADAIKVTFSDDYTATAKLKQYDANTGLAILSVKLSDIGKSTKENIKDAVLGNSYSTTQGEMVIAIGSPSGSNYTISDGTILSIKNKVSTIDANYSVFTTDIIGNAQGSGVIINLKGEVIAIILQNYSGIYDQNTVTAVSISELKTNIEKLSNGEQIAYVGIKGATVTANIADEQGIPEGLFVTEIEADSPAYEAGITNADVIVDIDGISITGIKTYQKLLTEHAPGDNITITVMRKGANEYKEIECSTQVGVLK